MHWVFFILVTTNFCYFLTDNSGFPGDGWNQLAIEKIDADSTTQYNLAVDSRNSPSSVSSRSPMSPQVNWPNTSASPNSPISRCSQISWRPDQIDNSTRALREEFTASPTHPQSRIPNVRLNSPMHMSPNTKATPPQLSPSNSQEWPYQESWDSNSPSVSPQASPFRVPRGRPPSRNHFMTTPQSPTQEASTFLKPFPPNTRDNLINSESQTASNKSSDILKFDFNQSVKTESVDWHNWNSDKQTAWNEKCSQKNYFPTTPPNNIVKSEWPTDYNPENMKPANMQNHQTEDFKRIPVIKQETPASWFNTEENQKNEKYFMLPLSGVKSDRPSAEQNYSSELSNSVERKDSKLPSFPSYGCQVSQLM